MLKRLVTAWAAKTNWPAMAELDPPPLLKPAKSWAKTRPSKWIIASFVAEIGGESAVLNQKMDKEIIKAQEHYGKMQSGGQQDDYAHQGDMSMYTKENLIKRSRLKSHPGMVDGFAEFWELLNPLKTEVPEAILPRFSS